MPNDLKLDKTLFYDNLKQFSNKHLPIFFNMPINRSNFRYRIIFSWHSRKPNGDFDPMMSCQLIDTFKQGSKKYVVPDFLFDCVKEKVTTDFKLYKHLAAWVANALKDYNEEQEG